MAMMRVFFFTTFLFDGKLLGSKLVIVSCFIDQKGGDMCWARKASGTGKRGGRKERGEGGK